VHPVEQAQLDVAALSDGAVALAAHQVNKGCAPCYQHLLA
jgi:hypothetical protein